MANIRKRTKQTGEIYYTVQVRLKGYPVQTASFERLTDARKWAQSVESAIREGRHFKTSEAKRHTFQDVFERYIRDVLPQKPKSMDKQKAQLEWWNERLGPYCLADITPALIVKFRDELANGITCRGTRRSPSTVVRYLAALSHVFSYAAGEWELLTDNPVRRVKKPKEAPGRVRFLDDNERERLLTACRESKTDVLYLCVVLALSTGMRYGEMMRLQWKDIDLRGGAIILNETKNGERRRVPITGLALELLRQHAKVRAIDTPLVFPGKYKRQQPLDITDAFEYALKKAGISDFRWHDLRHCTATYLAMNSASLAEIAEVLGHKTLAMVKRYAHLSDGHVSSVVAAMNQKIFGNGGS
ncbi:MAG: site-specific integrase [Methylomicrobium sp.]